MNGPVPPHVARVLERLAGVCRSGNGWSAKCPVHGDEHASLSVNVGEDGRVLLCCHAGCTVEKVCQALGIELRDLFPDAPAKRESTAPHSRFAATYRYRNESRKELYQVIRYRNPKDFRVCRRLPGGGTEWKLGNVRRVLYRLPELLAANLSEPIFVVEGEKDADNLAALGLVATTGIGGAGKWRGGDYNEHLRERHVVILPDNDKAGEAHALDVAWQLHGAAASMKIVALPSLPPKGDVSDWLVASGTREQLLRLAAETPLHEPDEPPEPARRDDNVQVDAKRRTSDLLIGLAECAEFFHAPGGDGEAHVTVPVGEHRQTCRVRSSVFRRWLLRRFYEAEGRAPNAQAVQDALGVLIARALFDGPEVPVHVRCAEHDGAYWLDLADTEWRSIRVTPTGWDVVDNPPVKFVRPRGMLSLPEPERGGLCGDLHEFVNAPDDGDWALLLAWLVAALRPCGPYPILVLNGEAGSAKSTTCRIIRSLIDPNAAPLRSEPRETRDLHIAASNSWLCCFDNLSSIRPGLSDDLCRLATGGGFATRELYSDSEETIFDSTRPVMLNGIDDLTSRGDLTDRAVILTLPPIPEHARRTETELFAAFERLQPGILGALLDAVSCGMRRLPSVKLTALPRMADFATWAVATEPALGMEPGAFLNAYAGNREARVESIIESATLGPPLLGLLHARRRWEGTARELLAELTTNRHSDEKTRKRRDWPATPKALANALRRLAPPLRAVGVEVSFARQGKARTRTIVIETERPAWSAQSASSANLPGTFKNADLGRTVGRTETDGDRPPPSAGTLDSDPETAAADCADCADGTESAFSDDVLPEADNDNVDAWEAEA